MPNVDKGDAHVDNICKKLKKLYVQQIQNARLMPVSLLNRIRRAKSASGDQNTDLKKLALLRLHLPNATFNNAVDTLKKIRFLLA